MRIHMHYLFWLVVLFPYLFWLYFFWSFSCSLILYLLARSLAHSPMLFHFTDTHSIIFWAPYLTISLWNHHSIPLPHSWSVTQFPVTFMIVVVCDSTFLLPLPYHQSLTCFLLLILSCTTTYSLVCACFPSLYKPYIPQLYSLTWIYLVLPSYLVHNHSSPISLYLWSLASLWPLVIASKDLPEAFIIVPYDSGYNYHWLQDSTCALVHWPTYPKRLDCDLWPVPVLQASWDYPSKKVPQSSC